MVAQPISWHRACKMMRAAKKKRRGCAASQSSSFFACSGRHHWLLVVVLSTVMLSTMNRCTLVPHQEMFSSVMRGIDLYDEIGDSTQTRPTNNSSNNICSTPEQILTERSIPEVHNNATQILQVFSIIRHGNRAPDNATTICWDKFPGFDFDCRWKEISHLPILRKRRHLFATTTSAATQRNYSYYTGETCPPGLLFEEAYDEVVNTGRLVQDAYTTTKAKRMQLLQSNV